MPWTISHPAAAVPFARRGLALSALVVGSMAPDFVYFLPLPFNRAFSHSLPGLGLLVLPLSLVSLWLFHRVLKWPLLALLPIHQQERLLPHAGEFAFGPARRFALIVASVLVGALTHLVWDGFTHASDWGVRLLPILETPWFGSLPIYRALQHGSTIGGALALAYGYARWFRRAPRHVVPAVQRLPTRQRLLWIVGLAVGVGVLTGGYGLFVFLTTAGQLSAFHLLQEVSQSSGLMLALELLAFSLLLKRHRWRLYYP
jgi:hypothetical protein